MTTAEQRIESRREIGRESRRFTARREKSLQPQTTRVRFYSRPRVQSEA